LHDAVRKRTASPSATSLLGLSGKEEEPRLLGRYNGIDAKLTTGLIPRPVFVFKKKYDDLLIQK